MEPASIELGSWVSLNLSKSDVAIIGTVAFNGYTDFSDGVWLGIVLVPECRKFAKNKGSVQGKQYFTQFEQDRNSTIDTNQSTANFGIFVRPEKINILSVDDVIALANLSVDSKIQLLHENIETQRLKYIDLLSKFEIINVEYLQSLSETESFRNQLKNLTLDYNALKESNESHGLPASPDFDSTLENRKLKLSLTQLSQDFTEKENSYIDTITSLKKDVSYLEKKINSLNLPDNILSDLNDSELLIEKLTLDNTSLISEIKHLNSKIDELEAKIRLNDELNSCYQQTEVELNDIINDLKVQLDQTSTDLRNEKLNLEKANQIIIKLSSSLSSSSPPPPPSDSIVSLPQASLDASLYKNLLLSFEHSFIDYLSFIKTHLCDPKYLKTLEFYKSLYQLKHFIGAILKYSEINRAHSHNWNLLRFKIEFIEHLLPYDFSNTLYKYKTPIDNTISLILHWLMQNDEANDSSLLLSIATPSTLSLNPYDESFEILFESPLLRRELLIYTLNLRDERNEALNQLRLEHKGVANETANNIAMDSINGTFPEVDAVDLVTNPIWKLESPSNVKLESTADDKLQRLETKIQILQSKLLDEKQSHLHLISLQQKIDNESSENNKLNGQISALMENEDNLWSQVCALKGCLQKYGIKNDTLSLRDEFDILEKNKLLNTIQNQRRIISNLSDSRQLNISNFPFLESDCVIKTKSSVDSCYYRRIDKLFNINTGNLATSDYGNNLYLEKLLEYINLC